jgi:hypothetical protein
MKAFKERKSWIVLTLILFLFAACKGESPTAPSTTTTTTGNTPPVSSSLTLTSSNTSPVVDSIVTITATATLNNAPVPNGTAIEFQSTGGALDGGGTSIIKTTTNGVASVSLTSSSAVPVRVSATVNNVNRFVDVTFSAKPVVIPPVETIPSISSVSPAVGPPTGGQIIRINGANFRAPVRVLFDTGLPLPVEASVVAVTSTTIDVVTPSVNLGAGQQLLSDIILITEVGTTTEYRVEAADAFTFRNEQLTPVISTLSPSSGPVTGGTEVKIFGSGFQAPTQVMFGTAAGNIWQEAKVVQVNYGEIIVVAPDGRSTSPAGNATVTGPVDVRVKNIASNTEAVLGNGFRYVAALAITSVSPREGAFVGGTRVQIDGIGFLAPVAVTIGGVAAQPISVSGTRIIAMTSALNITSCGDSGGPVVVTNINNGDQAEGGSFTYRVPQPTITGVSPSAVTEGGNITVTVANAQPGVNRIKLGDRVVFPTSSIFNPDGSATFTVAVPTNFTFSTTACTVGPVTGTRNVPLVLDVSYINVQTGCTDLAEDAATVNPTDASCQIPPPPTFVMAPANTCAAPGNFINIGNVPFTDPATGSTTFTILNSGGQPLIVSSVAVTGSSNATVTAAPTNTTVAPQASTTITVTANPTAAGAFSGQITVNTNDPTTPSQTFCFSGNGT